MTKRKTTHSPYYYSKDESELILDALSSVDRNNHRQVLEACQVIHETYLPHRAAESIRDHWYLKIGKRDYHDNRSLDRLLTPTQHRLIRTSIPVPNGPVRKIEGS